VRFQWRADGVALPGATTPTLRVAPAHAGKTISVTVTAAKQGYADVARTSAATPPVARGSLTLGGPPTLAGDATLGSTLTVNPPVVAPEAALSVQWLRAGVPVPGATGTTYRLGAADLGTRVSAEVRASRDGYDDLTSRTSSTAPIRTTPVVRVTPRPGIGRLSFTATVHAPGVRGLDGAIHVRSRGRFLQEFPVRNGVARGTVTGVPRATRVYRFWFVRSNTVHRAMVERQLRIL
jgi:hypothetical protein